MCGSEGYEDLCYFILRMSGVNYFGVTSGLNVCRILLVVLVSVGIIGLWVIFPFYLVGIFHQ